MWRQYLRQPMRRLFRNIFPPSPPPAVRFETWLRGAHAQLLRYARVFADAEHEAESILSDALAGVMPAFYAGRVEEAALLPYMLRAIKNAAFKENRQKERRHTREQHYELPETSCEHEILGAVLSDERALIEAALSRLPEKYARILRLVFWDGLSLADISRLHELPKSTVRYRYERALAQLKPLLAQHFTPPTDHA